MLFSDEVRGGPRDGVAEGFGGPRDGEMASIAAAFVCCSREEVGLGGGVCRRTEMSFDGGRGRRLDWGLTGTETEGTLRARHGMVLARRVSFFNVSSCRWMSRSSVPSLIMRKSLGGGREERDEERWMTESGVIVQETQVPGKVWRFPGFAFSLNAC